MKEYLSIISKIKSQLTGNSEHDIAFLVGQSKEWENHKYEYEILKETRRMLYKLLPADERIIIQDSIDNIIDFTNNLLAKANAYKAERKFQTAEKFIKEVFKYDHIIKDNKVTSYLNFNNYMEYAYYVWKFNPEKEIRANPLVTINAYHTYAYILVELKRYDEALDIIDKGLRLNPLNLNLLFEKSDIYKISKDWDHYKKINDECWEYSYSPQDLARTYRNYGYMFTEQEDFDGAIACYFASFNYEYTNHAGNELYYITQKTKKVIDEKCYRNNMKDLLRERNISYEVNENIMSIAFTLAKKYYDDEDYKKSYYFYNILYELTKAEEIQEILMNLNKHLEGQFN